MNLVLSLMVLSSVIAMNTAIVSSPSLATLPENVKKEKRGIYGLGVHGSHHHYEDSPIPPSHHVHGLPPLGPAHLAPVNLGAHYHTTVTKKIGVPYPVPYPVKVPVPIYNTIYKPVPVDRPVPVPHYVQVPNPYVINPHSPHLPPSHHGHHPWPARW